MNTNNNTSYDPTTLTTLTETVDTKTGVKTVTITTTTTYYTSIPLKEYSKANAISYNKLYKNYKRREEKNDNPLTITIKGIEYELIKEEGKASSSGINLVIKQNPIRNIEDKKLAKDHLLKSYKKTSMETTEQTIEYIRALLETE